ncbi:MAG: fused MFS/spermidine synthase [candidate division KSB1 bacterium]|nr:fused MFS/spermidine synthase [candidate division KSB1 bacterium]
MKNSLLYLIVSVSGASILALEILGTRILGPFYGVSIFLWSALITVTLAALSIGYFIGGWWADRGAKLERLSLMLGGAGVWLLIIPIIIKFVLVLIEPLGLRLSVLVAAAILFFPPLTLLGMISPYAIKIKTADLNKVGRSAGNLYAVSTLASVLAALGTGFWLIPNFGIQRLTLFIGLLLLLSAALLIIWRRKSKLLSIGAIIAFVLLTFLSWTAFAEKPQPERGLLCINQSAYGEIRVVEKDNIRYLLIDGAIHSIVNPTLFWEPQHGYVVVMDINQYFFDHTGSLLLIGLGGGSIANSYSMAGWKVAAVEIDPVVTKIATQYFGFRKGDCQVFHADGRQFLRSHHEKYDLIIMDAFGSGSIPFHLVTKQFFELVQQHLQPNGVFAINVQSIGWESKLVQAVAATLKSLFHEVIALPLHEPPNVLGNVILIAANRSLQFPDEYLGKPVDYVDIDPYEHWKVVQRNHAWDNRFVPKTSSSQILTDDRNPVDVWSEEINFKERKELHRFFGDIGVSW